IEELGLTQDQVTELEQLRNQCQAQTETIREQLKTLHEGMAELWDVDAPDATAIKTLAAKIDAVQAQMRNNCIDHRIAALEVLTTEQRTQLRELIRNRPGHGGGMGMGPGPGCGMGPGCGGPGGMGGSMMGGPGRGDGTGPRSQKGTCPLTNK
ncbi:MAG: hypothetical protein A2Z18_01020, partial [Armatimonadetes bacterium RBG_16_58_9]